ncbi:hypothetical protein [Streptomyces hydrogenans]|uniref:hypothetical protein n=1 Tax=Streptomyces hydrogenans TaxID=1873719 RepID=UPI003D74CF46
MLAWGDNRKDQTEVPDEAETGVTAIAAGAHHALALTKDGEVVAWGDNSNKQTDIPAEVKSGTVTAIAAGKNTSAAIVGGKVYAWGATHATQKVPTFAQSKVVQVAVGTESLAAVKEDGKVIEWKVNNASYTNVTGATDVRALTAGAHHFVVLKGDPPQKH